MTVITDGTVPATAVSWQPNASTPAAAAALWHGSLDASTPPAGLTPVELAAATLDTAQTVRDAAWNLEGTTDPLIRSPWPPAPPDPAAIERAREKAREDHEQAVRDELEAIREHVDTMARLHGLDDDLDDQDEDDDLDEAGPVTSADLERARITRRDEWLAGHTEADLDEDYLDEDYLDEDYLDELRPAGVLPEANK